EAPPIIVVPVTRARYLLRGAGSLSFRSTWTNPTWLNVRTWTYGPLSAARATTTSLSETRSRSHGRRDSPRGLRRRVLDVGPRDVDQRHESQLPDAGRSRRPRGQDRQRHRAIEQ